MVAPIDRPLPAPGSFGQASHPGYLGSPDLIAQLLGRFLAESEADLVAVASGTLGAHQSFEELARDRILDLAHVLSGEHPSHPGIAGWHDASLPGAVRGALGEFMAKNGAKWDDEPIPVLLEWLLVRLAAAWKTADGDDALLGTMLKPDIEKVRDLLTGAVQPA